MIRTVFRISWLNLKRDRMAMVLTFAVPIVFFSIFSAVFGTMDQGSFNPVRVALVDRAASPLVPRLQSLLAEQQTLRLSAPLDDRRQAIEQVRDGRLAVAVVLPVAGESSVELLADTSNPLAVQVVRGALLAAAARLSGLPAPSYDVEIRSVLGEGKRPSVSFFAAGIGVMFLLFAVGGRSAILIDERENGVLMRVLASQAGLTRLLIGRWAFLAALGAVQVTLMFVWAALVFGLDLWSPRPFAGFVAITSVTAAAAAGLGVLLSSCCRTRAQLNGLSVVVVLVMSALGGSMFPRFLMPEHLRDAGLLTFNAWALDGYHKVFWYGSAPWELWPQIAVLFALTAVFLMLSRLLVARRAMI